MPVAHINETDIYYTETGTGGTVLFLHGLGSSTRDWSCQRTHFAKDYRVVAVDIRGHGKSGKPAGPYSIALFAQDVAELLEELDAGPAHVVGLSMGGMIAFQLAVDSPALVRSLCVVNSGPALILHNWRLKWQFKKRELIVRLLGMRKMGTVLAETLFPLASQKALYEQFVDRWARNDRRAYLESLRALIGWSVADRIGSIRCPTLIVSADHDYTPVAYKQAYAAQIPDAEVAVINDSRHMTPIDQADVFNNVVGGFLEKCSARGISGRN